MNKQTYFPQIDGLRAIAVLSVILFHINSAWLPGGFVGVDVFFVISGFLITRIILTDLKEKTFQFSTFYQKRMRRILPALYAVVFASLLVGYLLLLPQDIKPLNKSAHKTILFWANYYFASYYDYFGLGAHELPLLHMWSLAVEEQFYFIVPLGLYVLNRFFPNKIGFLIVVGIIGSFTLGQLLLQYKYKVTWAYYALPTRAGQLLTGSLLAYQYLTAFYVDKLALLKRWGGYSGLFMLLVGFCFLSERDPYPGVRALLPTIGSYLILLCITSNPAPNHWILTNWISRKVGQMSYSLYLWHWPILAYMRYVYGEKDLPVSWVVIAALLMPIFAIFSWKFIETPLRKKSLGFKKTLIWYFVIPSVFIFSLTRLSNYLGLTKNNLPTELTSYGGPELCHGVIHKSCTRGDLTKKPKALLIGDSHAAHLNYFFDELGKKQGFSIDVVTASSCSPIFGYDETVLHESAQEPCRLVKRYIEENYKKYEVILIGSNWTYHLGFNGLDKVDYYYFSKLEKMLLELQKEGKKVKLISQVPLLKISPHRGIRFKKLGLPILISEKKTYIGANEKIKKLAEKFSNIIWMDITKTIKNNFFFGSNPIYMDDQHLNKFGAINIAK